MMQKNKGRNMIIAITAIFAVFLCLLCVVSIRVSNESASAVVITQEESTTKYADYLRYGYDVAAGKPLCDGGLKSNAPILAPLDEGLYKYIFRGEDNVKVEANNYDKDNALEIAKQSGQMLSGGISANIKIVNMNIDTQFNRQTSISNAQYERYQYYYQMIQRYYYLIQDTVDIRQYLSTAFRTDLYNVKDKSDALILFNKYGTHLFTGYRYGGILQVTSYRCATKTETGIYTDVNLETKMGAAYNGYGAQTSFNFSEQNTAMENTADQTSNYKVTIYGGEAFAALTLDNLFMYNASYLDGNGNYIYDRWVKSINNDKDLVILGLPDSGRYIPLWDLLGDGSENNTIRSYLREAYIEHCGDKYDEYCQKYFTQSRTIGGQQTTPTEEFPEYAGYTTKYKNGDTIYNEYNENVAVQYIPQGSTISLLMDPVNIYSGEWHVENGDGLIEIIDSVQGIFKVKENATIDGRFSFGYYIDDNKKASTGLFAVKQYRYSGGLGTASSPYLISTKEDLVTLSTTTSDWSSEDKYFALTKNIDCAGQSFAPIGANGNPFKGTFDGNYCTIKNVQLQSNNTNSIKVMGFFGYNEGKIKNLVLESINAIEIKSTYTALTDLLGAGNLYVGILAGWNKGEITNCTVRSSTINIKFYTRSNINFYGGGLVGYMNGGKVNVCRVDTINASIKNAHPDVASSDQLNNVTDTTAIGAFGGCIGCIAGTAVENTTVKNINPITEGGKTTIMQGIAKTVTLRAAGLIGFASGGYTIKNCVVGTYSFKEADVKPVCMNQNRRYVYSFFTTEGTGTATERLFALIVKEGSTKLLDAAPSGSPTVTEKESVTVADCDFSTQYWENVNSFPVLKKQMLASNPLEITPEKTEFYYGERFTVAGVKVKGKDKAGTEIIIPAFTYDDSAFNNEQVGEHIITIAALGTTITYKVNVKKPKVVGLEIEATRDDFYVGDTVNKDDFNVYFILENNKKVIPSEADGNKMVLPSGQVSMDEIKYVLGENQVTVSCEEMEASIIVEAVKKEIDRIEVTKQPNKIVYYDGQKLDTKGMEVTVYYKNGTNEIANNSDVEVIGERLTMGTDTVRIAYDNYITCNLSGLTVQAGTFIVIFKDWDGRELSSTEYSLGDTVVAPADPTRAADATAIYTFAGWDKPIIPCEGSTTYMATYTSEERKYTVIFRDWDGSTISEKQYIYEATISVPEDPIREADVAATYTFTGWDNEVTPCYGNAIYTATYRSVLNTYTVIFRDWDNTIISEVQCKYGQTPIEPSSPVREPDNTTIYTFAGWDKQIVACEGNTTYTATYTTKDRLYTVTFRNWDNSIISEQKYGYGAAVIVPANPTRDADMYSIYVFAGWDKPIVACEGNTTYTATYTVNNRLYTVTFKDWDNSIISEQKYGYGATVIAPANPTRNADMYSTYAFAGWDKPIVACQGDTTYTATYTTGDQLYTVIFRNWDNSIISEQKYGYGAAVIVPANPTRDADMYSIYVFAGWDKPIVACEGNTTYTATYTVNNRLYTVTFKDWDNSIISEHQYVYGATVEVPDNPSRATTNGEAFVFAGWDKDVTLCEGNKVYTATYVTVVEGQAIIDMLSKIQQADLGTFAIIQQAKHQYNLLDENEKKKVDWELNRVIGLYQEYVRGINDEFKTAKEIDRDLFSIMQFFNAFSIIGYLLLSGGKKVL